MNEREARESDLRLKASFTPLAARRFGNSIVRSWTDSYHYMAENNLGNDRS